jgi:hypothetical protein
MLLRSKKCNLKSNIRILVAAAFIAVTGLSTVPAMSAKLLVNNYLRPSIRSRPA